MKLTKTTQVLSAALLLGLASGNVAAQKLYKWVDSNGKISYQDQPPPENAKVLDEKEVAPSIGGSTTSATGNQTPVKVYTVADCATCDQAVLHLIKLGVPHVELPLNDDREAQALILEKTQRLIAPTIMIGDEVIQAPSNQALSDSVKAAGYEINDDAGTPAPANSEPGVDDA